MAYSITLSPHPDKDRCFRYHWWVEILYIRDSQKTAHQLVSLVHFGLLRLTRLLHLHIHVEISVLQPVRQIVVVRILVQPLPRNQIRHQSLRFAPLPSPTDVNTGTADGGPTSDAVPSGNAVSAATIAAWSPPMLIPPTTSGPKP